MALERLAASINNVPLLADRSGNLLPGEICCTLLERVLDKGRLTPRVLELFERTEHEEVMERIAGMGISRWTPPLLPTSRNGWLGYSRPAWE